MEQPRCSEFNDLSVGMSATIATTLGKADIARLTAGSNNTAPSNGTSFRILSARALSAAAATILPGPSSIYISQNLPFTLPVQVDDLLQTVIVVNHVATNRTRVHLGVECSVNGAVVISGEAQMVLLAPAMYWFGSAADLVDPPQVDAVLAHDHQQLARLDDERTAKPRSMPEDETANVFLVNRSNAFASVSAATARAVEEKPTKRTADSAPQRVHPADRPALEALQQRLISHAVESETLTMRLLHPERDTMWVELQTRPQLNVRTGAPDGYIAVLRHVARPPRSDNLRQWQTLKKLGRPNEPTPRHLELVRNETAPRPELDAGTRARSLRQRLLFNARTPRRGADTGRAAPLVVLRVPGRPGIDPVSMAQACEPFYAERPPTSATRQRRAPVSDDEPDVFPSRPAVWKTLA